RRALTVSVPDTLLAPGHHHIHREPRRRRVPEGPRTENRADRERHEDVQPRQDVGQDRVRREPAMTSLRALLAAGLCASLLAGCTYYEVAPGVYTTTPTCPFDRSWGAA